MRVSPRSTPQIVAVAALVVVTGGAAVWAAASHPWTGRSSPGPPVATSGQQRASPAPAAPLHPGLNVAGNRLVDGSGAQVILHGANISGTESTCAQNWTSDPFGGQPEDDPQTLSAMRSWHFNAVRIPLNEDCWLGINGVEIGGTAYQTALIQMVHDYEHAGFYVIVDLHWSAPGAHRALAQNPAPDEDHSPEFWRSVATTFRADESVVFDLFNEPYFYWIGSGGPDPWTCLWHGCEMSQFVTGGSPYTIATPWRTAGFAELIAAIRSTGAANLILAAGVNWARDLSGWLAHRTTDANLAASWHAYASANPSLESECAQPACWNGVVAPLANQVPVIAGETGDSSDGPETFLPSFLPWADSHKLGYLAWAWNAWKNPSDVLVTDMRTGAPTAGEGALVRSHLLGQPAAG